jgi:hypothetical protein
LLKRSFSGASIRTSKDPRQRALAPSETPTSSPIFPLILRNRHAPFRWFGKPLLIPSKVLVVPMFAPGIISLAFYKRKPSLVQVILGLVATVVLSALLGYISPGGPLGQVGSAVVGGVILYVVILALLLYWYQPRHAKPPMSTPPAPAPE